MSEKSVRPGAHRLFPHMMAGAGNERYQAILMAAATLFAERGYAGTSVRDIGEKVGILGGSLYHYIKSKDELFVTIHNAALQAAADVLAQEIARFDDPWRRLETACITLLDIQLDPDSLTMPLMNDFRAVPPEVRVQLVAKRDEFERIFTRLVDDLPLAPGLDRGVYRLLLLTILNNISGWYRPGRLPPEEIGRQIMALFRREAAAVPPA